MNLFYQPLLAEGIHHLDEEESKHCVKVLRKSVGDTIKITDGKGQFYDCVITKADARNCEFSITNITHSPKKSFSVHIAVSPTKNADRIEWFVEKATEIGIDEISLIECENTERSFIKSERLKKVAISAMKQSLKATLPLIHELRNFSTVLQASTEQGKFIAYVDNQNPITLQNSIVKNQSTLVLIGPEGDFTNTEIEKAVSSGFKKVSLGPSRLRTETAAIAACHIINLMNA